MFFKLFSCALIGYLLGSVVAAILVSSLFFKEDVRSHGSGNSGATNAARVYGVGYGLLTFLGDFAKGLLACWLGKLIGGDVGLAVAGFASVVGHCFPVFFRFRGGKGVSVGGAFALMVDWRIFVAAFILFLLLALITRIVSAGSLGGIITVGVLMLLLPEEPAVRILGFIAALLVVFMHRGNIARLFNGTEKRMTFGGRG